MTETSTYWYESPLFHEYLNGNTVQHGQDLLNTKPKFRSDMTVSLVECMGDENSIVNAARASNDRLASEFSDKANKGLIKSLIKNSHGTPFEYPHFTLYLEVPIFVSRQVVKYRNTSINESSGRYSNAVPEFYITHADKPIVQVGKTMNYEFIYAPKESNLLESLNFIEQSTAEAAWENYSRLRAYGVAKEDARKLLPTSMYSHMYVSMNLRSMIHFITQRTHNPNATVESHPQWEIEQVAKQMAEIVKEKFPTVWEALEENRFKKI